MRVLQTILFNIILILFIVVIMFLANKLADGKMVKSDKNNKKDEQ